MSDEHLQADITNEENAEDAPPTRFIRTYAKDLAAMSGGKASLPVTAPKSEPASAPPSRIEEASAYSEPSSATPVAEQSPDQEPGMVAVRGPRRPAPESRSIYTAVPSSLAERAAASAPPRKEISEDEPARFHTYKSDFVDHASEASASTFSVVAAEQDAPSRAAAPRTSHTLRFVAFAGGGMLLLVAGGALAYFGYMNANTPDTVPIAEVAPSLIFVDERAHISGTGAELLHALATNALEPLAVDKVRLVYVTKDIASPVGTTTEPAAGGALITDLHLPAPGILLRNIDPASTVGIAHAGDETRPFFIIRATSYNRTFAGMLEWEATLPRDLATLYPSYSSASSSAPLIAASSATTSSAMKTSAGASVPAAAMMPAPFGPTGWHDETVENYDVRVFRDETGRSLALYGYRDQNTLIIARDEAAFVLLAHRLTATKTQ